METCQWCGVFGSQWKQPWTRSVAEEQLNTVSDPKPNLAGSKSPTDALDKEKKGSEMKHSIKHSYGSENVNSIMLGVRNTYCIKCLFNL